MASSSIGLVRWLLLLGAGLSGAAAAAQPHPVPATEPPESVIVKILERQYEDIRQRGGMKVQGATVRGQPVVLKPRIWQARKTGCRPLPQSPPGDYECTLDLKVTLVEGDRTPGQHGERVMVGWDDASGEWADLATLRERRTTQARAASRAARERQASER